MLMWLKKKFVLIALLTLVVLGGTLGGIAIAQGNDEPTAVTDNTSLLNTLLDKVATIYQQNTGVAINAQELAKALTQAQKDMRATALDNYLNDLVSKGKITQDQADQFKTWLNAKPDVNIGPGFNGMFRGMGKMGGMFGGRFGGRFGGMMAPNANSGTSE
jgi:hypothetical protein